MKVMYILKFWQNTHTQQTPFYSDRTIAFESQDYTKIITNVRRFIFAYFFLIKKIAAAKFLLTIQMFVLFDAVAIDNFIFIHSI